MSTSVAAAAGAGAASSSSSSPLPYHAEAAAAARAVRLASKLCERVQATLGSGEKSDKEDDSPVTVADYGAQALVAFSLTRTTTSPSLSPSAPFSMVAEEDSADLRDPAKNGPRMTERIAQLVNEVLRDEKLVGDGGFLMTGAELATKITPETAFQARFDDLTVLAAAPPLTSEILRRCNNTASLEDIYFDLAAGRPGIDWNGFMTQFQELYGALHGLLNAMFLRHDPLGSPAVSRTPAAQG